jgi:hypothetical protein
VNFVKKILLFVLLYFSGLTVKAQSNWAPIGATWMYRYVISISQDTSTCYIKSIADTVIHGQVCRKLLNYGSGCSLRPLYGYMYEDSGRVYFYDFQRDIFQLLFNINAGVGEKFSLMPGLPPYNDSLVTMVDSATTININGHLLRKLIVHIIHHTPYVHGYGGEIIENIGNTLYMYPWIYNGCDEVYSGPLGCY